MGKFNSHLPVFSFHILWLRDCWEPGFSFTHTRMRSEHFPGVSNNFARVLAFVVGEFDYVEDRDSDNVLIRVYTPKGKKEQGQFALEVKFVYSHLTHVVHFQSV